MSEIKLRDESITLKQFRTNGWLPSGHDGEYRYTQCFEEIVLLADSSGYPVTGLTTEQEAQFEKLLNMKDGSLSRFNKDYWSKYRIKIPRDGLNLDLKNPKDLLSYTLLLSHQAVANSEVEKHDSPFAQYVLTSTLQEAKVTAKKVNLKKEAYKVFSGMSTVDMEGFLKVYGKRPGKNATADWLESEIGKIIETSPQDFLDVCKDANLKTKIFIDDCISKGALKKIGSKYALAGGDVIGYSLEETITYLNDKANQEVYISLKSKIDV
jgi:hypothetical protein